MSVIRRIRRVKLAPPWARSAIVSSMIGVEAVRLAITRMRGCSVVGTAGPP
jgi:hypothetical protein